MNSVRGDVYRLKKPRSSQRHEQQGDRYAVAVQANAYEHLSTWLVAPTTTKSFGSLIRPTIELLGQDVRVTLQGVAGASFHLCALVRKRYDGP
jgi:mRNA interferase MazF